LEETFLAGNLLELESKKIGYKESPSAELINE
jgi:hypothetical protein